MLIKVEIITIKMAERRESHQKNVKINLFKIKIGLFRKLEKYIYATYKHGMWKVM